MSRSYVITPMCGLTDEDAAIINTLEPAIIGPMLVNSTWDAILFGQAEWNRKWNAEAQWAMDNIY